MSKEKTIELENQLHEQYAINNNANVSSFISFLVSVITIFIGYGYVFAYNTFQFSCKGFSKSVYSLCPKFSYEVLIYMTIVSVIILTFLILLCIQLGYSHRRDHIIIDKIRDIRYKDCPNDKKEIFGNLYNSSNKKIYNYLPNIYMLFIVFFVAIAIIFNITTSCYKPESELTTCWSCMLYKTDIICGLLIVGYWFCTFCFYNKHKKKTKNANQTI